MAWIELHQTLREHKKMFACADMLNLSRIEMIGTLVSLWLWALDNAQDGSLEGVSDKTIARVCDFPEKKAGKLIAALLDNGFIDFDGDHYIIHDWFDYAGKLMERREKDRKRKGKSSGKQADFQRISDGNPAEIHGNSCATVPNRTLPYPTVPNISGGDGEFARANTAGDDEVLSIGLTPGEYPGVTSETVRAVTGLTDGLFRRYKPQMFAQPWDYRKVFMYFGAHGRHNLLDYAFEAAAVAGKPCDWRYIDGIMEKLFLRGIETVQQAREWDLERPDKDCEDDPL